MILLRISRRILVPGAWMKRIASIFLLLLTTQLFAQAPQAKTPATLKSILLQGLQETHNQKNWFVSGKEAMEGLTPEQAVWTDGKNHSVGQLVKHIVFWNSRVLAQFKGEKSPEPPANDETFKLDPKQWAAVVKQFDDDMTKLEELVSAADD